MKGRMNIRRPHLAYDSIKTFLQFQNHPYPFEPIPKVQELLANLDFMNENDCFQASLQCEPRKCEKQDLLI